jgi:predicted PurR-regulated permease PerM
MVQRATTSVPTVLNATLNMLTNAILAFFLLYYMLVDGRKMEYTVQKYIPLKDTNIDDIWEATRVMVVSNAIGIPVLAASQAIVSILGYYMFGIEEYVLWGVITGVFSLVPIIGTAVVWIPLCVYLYAIDRSGQGTGLLLYSLLITGSVDNILRFTILRRLGDIHPITTALGIMVGIPLFGFMGFIFGPMLISYFLLLVKIYRVEFSPRGSMPD